MTAAVALPQAPSVAEQIRTLTTDDVRAGLRGRVEPWALIQSLGPIRRDRPHVLAVTIGSASGEQSSLLFASLDPRQLRRWDGYRLTMIGVPVRPETALPPTAPVLECRPDDRDGPPIRLLLLSQWAIPEHTDIIAWARWDAARGEVVYGEPGRTEALSYRDGLLLAHGEQLLEIVTRRGRPLETPLRARVRLAEAESSAHDANRRGRAALADAAAISVDGIDKLKLRTNPGDSSAPRNKVRTTAPRSP